jgi:hypothetical protein
MSQGAGRRWTVDREPALRGYQVEWADEEELLLSKRNQLFRTKEPGAPLELVAGFPAPAWRAAAARMRPLQRLLRFVFYNVIKLRDGRLFVSFDRSIGLVDGGRFEPIRTLRPARILRGACALADDGNVYFGEYLANRERGPIRIYRYTSGRAEPEVVHDFSSHGVRHVHGIYRDPHDGSLWCATGDVGGECRILRSEDGFASIETVGEGDESWRSVSLAFTESHVYYAMDAQFEQNRILRLDRRTYERQVLGDVDGPVYFCRAVGRDVFFTVTAELCPSQVGRAASLVRISDDGEPETLCSFEKDRFRVGLFMMGTLNFPSGPWAPDRFYLHGVGLQQADNETFVVRRS